MQSYSPREYFRANIAPHLMRITGKRFEQEIMKLYEAREQEREALRLQSSLFPKGAIIEFHLSVSVPPPRIRTRPAATDIAFCYVPLLRYGREVPPYRIGEFAGASCHPEAAAAADWRVGAQFTESNSTPSMVLDGFCATTAKGATAATR